MKEKGLLEYYEGKGRDNILKYFDRLHDKLFTFNNILIGGYFVLSKIDESIDVVNILWPISNMLFFIFIEHRMYYLSKKQSKISKSQEHLSSFLEKTMWISGFSILSILSTTLVTFIFVYFLMYS